MTMSFSPTTMIRESCRRWMANEHLADAHSHTCNAPFEELKCSVSINHDALDNFATHVTESILTNKSLQISEWDADGWHYTGKKYNNHQARDDHYTLLMRMERVALYILSLDAINFCFWPSSEGDGSKRVKNVLEYEHLAIALRNVAELDDDAIEFEQSQHGEHTATTYIQSASTYALGPANLACLTPEKLRDYLQPHFPPSQDLTEIVLRFDLPDLEIRCQLLNELGQGILDQHKGSALHMIAKADRSADALVRIILDTFPGFRDYVDIERTSNRSPDWESVKTSLSVLHFYKRAQIAVADLWAALERCGNYSSSAPESMNSSFEKLLNCCQFTDMKQLTTFPDYRVPQILRHVGVLQYETQLAHMVDCQETLKKGGSEEISIRVGTVLAVEELVHRVKVKLMCLSEENQPHLQTLANDTSAVTIDWYLWQHGEKMDRLSLLQPHHRVYTSFY